MFIVKSIAVFNGEGEQIVWRVDLNWFTTCFLSTYERLKLYIDKTRDTLFPPSQELYSAVEEIYRYPLQEMARDTLNRQLRSGIDDEQLVNLVTNLRADNHLCQVHEQEEPGEPQIICSLGLFEGND